MNVLILLTLINIFSCFANSQVTDKDNYYNKDNNNNNNKLATPKISLEQISPDVRNLQSLIIKTNYLLDSILNQLHFIHRIPNSSKQIGVVLSDLLHVRAILTNEYHNKRKSSWDLSRVHTLQHIELLALLGNVKKTLHLITVKISGSLLAIPFLQSLDDWRHDLVKSDDSFNFVPTLLFNVNYLLSIINYNIYNLSTIQDY